MALPTLYFAVLAALAASVNAYTSLQVASCSVTVLAPPFFAAPGVVFQLQAYENSFLLDEVPMIGSLNITATCVDSSNVVIFRGSCAGIAVSNSVDQDLLITLLDTALPAGSYAPVPLCVLTPRPATKPIVVSSTTLFRDAISASTAMTYTTSSVPSSFSFRSAGQCVATTSSCNMAYNITTADASGARKSSTVTVTGAGRSTTFSTTHFVQTGPTGNFRVVNIAPAVVSTSAPSDMVPGQSATITALVVDVDASDLSVNTDLLSYSWAVQALDIATGSPITGSYCLTSWMSIATSGTRVSTGAAVNFGFNLLPSGPAAQTDQRCRYTLTVTDPEGLTATATVSVNISTVTRPSTTVTTQAAVASQIPMRLRFTGFTMTGTVVTTDKCSVVTCASETQCLTASSGCDRVTAICGPQTPKTGQACDDGDITTRDDTCTSAGICVGIDKCTGVVCTSFTPCHFPGNCNRSTGICEIGLPRPAGGACFDGRYDTVFDTCDAQGACIGINIAQYQSAPIPDLMPLALPNATAVFRTIETSNSGACCDRVTGVCCRPCDARQCGSGDFSELVYVLV